MPQIAVELKCAGLKGGPEPGDELASEHAAEHLDRQKEAAGRTDPSRVVRRQPAGSQHTVSMRVKLQSLIPRVQYAEEADLRAEMTWVAPENRALTIERERIAIFANNEFDNGFIREDRFRRNAFRRRGGRHTLADAGCAGALLALDDANEVHRGLHAEHFGLFVAGHAGLGTALAGRHGVLGMTLDDIDYKQRTVTVRLKGARDEHRVPVTDDFWPLLNKYLGTERRPSPDLNALWIAARK